MTNPQPDLAVVPYEPHESSAVVLWGTNDPRGMTARMAAVADAMADAVRARNMTLKISGREYVTVEGWSLVGAMVGVFPRPREVEEIREEGILVGFRATVDLVTRDGSAVGGAVALCTIAEEKWAARDWNQIASMAQTRATAKAYRQTLGFIMPMAGYAATPAEEMDGVIPEPPREAAERRAAGGWGDGAHKFVAAACKAYGLLEADIFRLLEVANGDELIEKAQHTDGGWGALATALKAKALPA